MHFLQFCADLSKKSKCIKAIYIYASQRSHYTLSENGIAYYALTYCFGYISWTMVQTPINHIMFWKSVMKTFRCIYVYSLDRLIFLAEVSTKLQKILFFWTIYGQQLRKETLTVCNFHFCIWKESKLIFMWSPLWFILVCKIPQFWAKANDSDRPSYLPRK